MSTNVDHQHLLGINGLGRIGKLTLWYHLLQRHFDGFVVNVGREVGKDMNAVLHTIETDSTYGSLHHFLYGRSRKEIELKIVDEEKGLLSIDGMSVKILRNNRNPRDIGWGKEGVRLVVECTGHYTDPTSPDESEKGSVRGHLKSGAEKIVISAPIKIKDSSKRMPADAGMFVYGINHNDYNPAEQHIISGASCTTTGLAHMMKPLLEIEETSRVLTASMSTIHAATNTQSILDSVPSRGAKDLRKNRSIINNIIITTTGAAIALEKIMPEIQRIGFMADSVRIPTNTASLIILNLTLHTTLLANGQPVITQDFLNNIYRNAANQQQRGLLQFSERQNVSADIIGAEASCTIEGAETHTRTGFMTIPSSFLDAHGINCEHELRIPVTHAKICGWYDNEYGSYAYTLGKLTEYVDELMY